MDELNTQELEKITKSLTQLLNELEEITVSTKNDREPVALDQSMVGRLSRMDLMQNQAMQVETGRRRELEVSKIKAALKRIETNDYGYCVSCDDEISIKRLQSDPAVPTCIACASKAG